MTNQFEDKITIDQANKFIASNVRLQYNQSCVGNPSPVLFLSGPPGIGKSEMYEQICKTNGWGLSTVYLAQCSMSQMSGLPMVRVTDDTGMGKFVPWSVPEIFRMDNLRVQPADDAETRIIILLCDDCHLIDKSRQNYLFQLLLQKRINDHQLPPEIVINLAGNGSEDKAGFQTFLSPVTNRIFYLNIYPDYDQWVADFAHYYGVRTDIIEFLAFSENYLMGTPLESSPWPSPRSWTFASDQLNQFESDGNKLDISNTFMIVKGLVGSDYATEYIQYIEILAGWEASKILDGIKSIDISELDRMQCYGLLTSVIRELSIRLRRENFNINLCNQEFKIFKDIMTKVVDKTPTIISLAMRPLIVEEMAINNNTKLCHVIINSLDNKCQSMVADMCRSEF